MRPSLKILLYLSILLVVISLLLNILFPLKVAINYSTLITDKDGTIINAYLTEDDKWRMQVLPTDISPELEKAILFKEDRYFYYHLGINPIAIGRALSKNIIQGKRTSGASTITMQLARLLQPKERSYINKLKEMFRAMQLEWQFSKKEILQLYLSLVPYGSNIEGIKSASVLFYEKAPNHLSLGELTSLCVIPNRPTSLQLGKYNEAIQESRDHWLNAFEKAQLFPNELIEDARSEIIHAKRQDAPNFAPHFSRRMLSDYENEHLIHSSLDLNMQKEVNQIVQNYSSRRYHQKIRNAAAIIIENETGKVRAYIGSADFNNSEDSGQVDGIQAIRSPGSTLKPLLYALAFDQGIVTPQLKVSDVPVNYSGYRPRNFNRMFNGLISVEKAIANSLNVPAVKVLNDYGLNNYIQKLSQAGFKKIKEQEDQLGLSVILGGCGVQLEELSALYSAFANQGNLRKLLFLEEDTSHVKVPLMSESAAYFLTDILTQLTRPDLPKNMESSPHLPKIAWKTGTSYGRRDAWSIGFNKKYTIGVWLGNFSGEGVPELTGSDIATPLLFRIFNKIDYNSPNEWFAPSEEMKYRWVCSESGLIPNDFCENQIMDYYLPLKSSTKQCDHMQKVILSHDEKFAHCRSCMPNTAYKEKLFPNYDADMVAYLEKENIAYQVIPPHYPKCTRIFQDAHLSISSPADGSDYLIDTSDNTEIMLIFSAPNDVEKVYWYVNNQFHSEANTHQRLFFTPKNGWNKVSCVDEKGRKAEVSFQVKFM